MRSQNVAILGSTGSIGCSTLEVISLNQEQYNITLLTANSQVDKLLEQCLLFKPKFAVILDESKAKFLEDELQSNVVNTRVFYTMDDLVKIITNDDVDIVMSAIVGSHGLLPTYKAIIAGKKVLLANKESLVAGGKLINQALTKSKNAILIPVDSEHSAIFQSLPQDYVIHTSGNGIHGNSTNYGINKIILTASGGPFRKFTHDELLNVTPEQAILHPNWSMGKKISVDSSTLMNKGLEVIEAYWLFGTGLDKIEVVVHPQSIIHSMVEYIDGSVVAQLGTPNMKTPIAYALAYPNRIISGSPKLDFSTLSDLTFEKPDYKRFPCLGLAFEALKVGGVAPAVLNAANEMAVAAFLANKIKFYDINAIIKNTMDNFASQDYSSIEEIIGIDKEARSFATKLMGNLFK